MYARMYTMVDKSIFVSIASYRDAELESTLDEVIDKASGRCRLRIVVCLQDSLAEYTRLKGLSKLAEVEWIYMPCESAKGVCWARGLILRKLHDEDYIMQIDSHTRLAQRWDLKMIISLNRTKDRRAILSCYPNGYDSSNPDIPKDKYAVVRVVDTITRSGSTHNLLKSAIPNETRVPIRSLHVAGCFIFAPLKWAGEIKYPIHLYHAGEEDWLRQRSFTCGWNVYCPERAYVWHNYELSEKRPRHWDDNKSSTKHQAFDARTVPCGPARSLEQYMVAMKQITQSYRNVPFSRKDELLPPEADIQRILIRLYYHDLLLAELVVSDSHSLDSESAFVRFNCTQQTLLMATGCRLFTVDEKTGEVRETTRRFV